MNQPIFQFGMQRPEFAVPVLNERAVRASAGLLFLFAMIAFMNAWLTGNFAPTRIFVVAFLVDFSIRLAINPRLAPSLIIGQWVVRQQQPDYVGAPQKRFAWAIGWVLALTMLYLVVIQRVIGPINLLVCSVCLLLLFFETAFGICLGCKVYNLFNRQKAQLCPGGACALPVAEQTRTSAAQWGMVLAFALVVLGVWQWVYSAALPAAQSQAGATQATPAAPMNAAEIERCKVPDFAKALGHEENWKLHNNCQ